KPHPEGLPRLIRQFNTLSGTLVGADLLCQASISSWGPDIRKGCPSIAHCHIKLDGLVGADVSRTLPMYRPSLAFSDISLHYLNLTISLFCIPAKRLRISTFR